MSAGENVVASFSDTPRLSSITRKPEDKAFLKEAAEAVALPVGGRKLKVSAGSLRRAVHFRLEPGLSAVDLW